MTCDRDCFNCIYDDCILDIIPALKKPAVPFSSTLEYKQAYRKAYYQKNKEKLDKQHREFIAKHPEKTKQYLQKSKNKQKGLTNSI